MEGIQSRKAVERLKDSLGALAVRWAAEEKAQIGEASRRSTPYQR